MAVTARHCILRYNKKSMQLRITTKKSRELIDITDEVTQHIPPDQSGIVHIFVLHTTAAVTTIDQDPGIDEDLFTFLSGITPKATWVHPHDPQHVPAHLLSSMIGPSVSIPYTDGRLQLGMWQQVVLVELNGPRERKLAISFTPVAQ